MQRSNEPPTILEVVGLAIAMLLVLALMLPVRSYLTDDTFIHLQYAKHLMQGKGFVFNVGERIYGCTSPLWVMLLALGMSFGANGLHVARILGFDATLLSVLLFYVLARRFLHQPVLRALATIAWAANAWMIRWSMSGMETPLAVALVLAGFVAFTAGEEWGSHPWWTGALWALAALVRPEATLLLALWAAVLAAGLGRPNGASRLVAGLLPVAVIYGGWLLFAASYYGQLFPSTLSAKTAGVGTAAMWDTLLREMQIFAITEAAIVLALVLGVVFTLQHGWPRRFELESLLPWGWVIGLPVLYAARGVPVVSRYLLPVLPVLALLAWAAFERWTVRRHGLRALAVVLAVLAIGQNLFWYRHAVLPQVKSFSAGMRQSLIPWGRWFGKHAGEDASIAVPDIGAIGYYSDRHVMDLGGLVTPGVVPLLAKQTLEEVVASFSFASVARPDYVIDRAPTAYDLLSRSQYANALVPLGSCALPNLGIARPETAVYSMYRIDWAAYDSLTTGAMRP